MVFHNKSLRPLLNLLCLLVFSECCISKHVDYSLKIVLGDKGKIMYCGLCFVICVFWLVPFKGFNQAFPLSRNISGMQQFLSSSCVIHLHCFPRVFLCGVQGDWQTFIINITALFCSFWQLVVQSFGIRLLFIGYLCQPKQKGLLLFCMMWIHIFS